MTKITVSKKLKSLHPVVDSIVKNLANIDAIQFIRVTPDLLQASSEATEGRTKTPITKIGHPTAIGVSLIVDVGTQDLIFYEMTSAVRGYGTKMVEAVLKDLPMDWNLIVGMDWSDGFWDKMCKKYKRITIL